MSAAPPQSINIAELAEADPLSLLADAAHGSVDAFRKMTLLSWAAAVEYVDEIEAYDLTYENGDPQTLIETSLVFSRLAAAGGEEQDVIGLSNFLHLAASLDGQEDERVGEAIAWIEREADAGSEKAATALNDAVAKANSAALEMARGFGERLRRQLPNNRGN